MKYAFKLNEKQHKRLEALYDFLYVLGAVSYTHLLQWQNSMKERC